MQRNGILPRVFHRHCFDRARRQTETDVLWFRWTNVDYDPTGDSRKPDKQFRGLSGQCHPSVRVQLVLRSRLAGNDMAIREFGVFNDRTRDD
jgi:hypothetical protein